MKLSTIMLLASLAMFVPAGLMWRMARIVSRDTDRFMQTARQATGTVLSLDWRSSRVGTERALHAYPEIAFTLPDGQRVQATARTGNLQRPAKVGDTVQVLYNPADPSEMDLATQAPRTLMQCGYRTLAVGFALFGVLDQGLWWLLFRLMGILA